MHDKYTIKFILHSLQATWRELLQLLLKKSKHYHTSTEKYKFIADEYVTDWKSMPIIIQLNYWFTSATTFLSSI